MFYVIFFNTSPPVRRPKTRIKSGLRRRKLNRKIESAEPITKNGLFFFFRVLFEFLSAVLRENVIVLPRRVYIYIYTTPRTFGTRCDGISENFARGRFDLFVRRSLSGTECSRWRKKFSGAFIFVLEN